MLGIGVPGSQKELSELLSINLNLIDFFRTSRSVENSINWPLTDLVNGERKFINDFLGEGDG